MKHRLVFLLLAVLLLTVPLACVTYRDAQEQERTLEQEQANREIRGLEAELREARDRVEVLEIEKGELEQIIINRSSTYRAVTISSRSGRAMPLLSPSGFSAADFEKAFAGTGLEGLGEALVTAEAEKGVNALALAAVCALESAWGTSSIARGKNNLAGLGAYDDCPGSALCFDSRAECVMYLAELLRDRPGESLEEVGMWYASDPGWAVKVARIMGTIARAAIDPGELMATVGGV